MSWPIGNARTNWIVEAWPNGTIFANGVRVTREGGWIELTLPVERDAGTAREITVQIRVVPDSDGRAFIYAESVVAANVRYGSVIAFITSAGQQWAGCLSTEVQDEIERRIRARSRPLSTRHRLPSVPDEGDDADTEVTTGRRRR